MLYFSVIPYIQGKFPVSIGFLSQHTSNVIGPIAVPKSRAVTIARQEKIMTRLLPPVEQGDGIEELLR